MNVLGATHKEVFTIFIFVCLTAPILGIIVGGTLVQKFAKGYEGKHSLLFCLLFSICATASALPVKWIESPSTFCICLWILVFFGAAVMPTTQGVMISSLSSDLRAAGNSLSNILQNLFAFIPAPFIYGYLYENTKASDPKLAMTITLCYSFTGIVLISFTIYYRYKNWKEIQNNIISLNKYSKENYDDQVPDEESQKFIKNEL